MKQKKKVRHSNRRRQQVRRQLLLIGCVIFIAICAIGSYQVHKKHSEAKEAAKIEQQKKEEKKKKKKTEKKETPEEHLERVRAKAISAGYPDGVIELLDKNPETVDFVENYPKKKDSKPAETIGDSLQPGSIPLLLQWDERWGYSTYGTSIIAISGCGPTCMAMVASGLNQDPPSPLQRLHPLGLSTATSMKRTIPTGPLCVKPELPGTFPAMKVSSTKCRSVRNYLPDTRLSAASVPATLHRLATLLY